jgi:regulator of sigma E protease
MSLLVGMALVLGLMIMIHEWGHFIVARLFKVRVDVFSVGFGPRLFGWKSGPTDYRISAIPLGGYVRMAGQDLSEVDSNDVAPTGAPDELMSKPRWQRALISFAGPAVNLVFPILLLTGYITAVGIPYPAYEDKPVEVVGFVGKQDATPGPIHVGDKVVSINGAANPTWSVAERVIRQTGPGGTLKLVVEGADGRRNVELPVKNALLPDTTVPGLGYLPTRPIIDFIEPGSPADRAGLKDGDTVTAINGQKIQYWAQFVETVRGSDGKPVSLDVDRNGRSVHLEIVPQQISTESGEKIYQIGVLPYLETAYRRVSFSETVRYSAQVTLDKIEDTIGIVGKLFSGRVSVKQLQSVVGISRAAGQAVRKGPLAVISMMVLISVNLGILNLLPIPILDGGNILLLTLEGIRRRDFSLAFKERFVQVGLVFLLVLFAYVMYNDVMRMLPSHS